jgi:hypothetical protein
LKADKEQAVVASEHYQEEKVRIEKQFNQVTNERDKLRIKISRLKMKKKNVDLNQKICKNCSREYLENENFNWSCRTHRVR